MLPNLTNLTIIKPKYDIIGRKCKNSRRNEIYYSTGKDKKIIITENPNSKIENIRLHILKGFNEYTKNH